MRHTTSSRFEIVEALALGLSVIPVLLDRTPRLVPADAPEPLGALPELQNLTLDHRHPDDGIDRIAEAIVTEVPALGTKPNSSRRGLGNRPTAADGAFRGNLFLGRTRVDGDVVGGDKNVWGTGERHG
ncbi:hypothetical protein [Streptomyces sp. KR55]|uniref:hypothetical protein n=1 Tax=Streptomyces sp. KR55 TaxID=3457425 RepID=UPI003FD32808